MSNVRDEFLVVRWPRTAMRNPANADGIKRPDGPMVESWFQKMANRMLVGWQNGYGLNRRYHYLTRIMLEIQAYWRTGNKEHLINAANYCYLESVRPEHPDSHWRTEAESVTRAALKSRAAGAACQHHPHRRFAVVEGDTLRGVLGSDGSRLVEHCSCGAKRMHWPINATGWRIEQ